MTHFVDRSSRCRRRSLCILHGCHTDRSVLCCRWKSLDGCNCRRNFAQQVLGVVDTVVVLGKEADTAQTPQQLQSIPGKFQKSNDSFLSVFFSFAFTEKLIDDSKLNSQLICVIFFIQKKTGSFVKFGERRKSQPYNVITFLCCVFSVSLCCGRLEMLCNPN
jgi:hypothetical protein